MANQELESAIRARLQPLIHGRPNGLQLTAKELGLQREVCLRLASGLGGRWGTICAAAHALGIPVPSGPPTLLAVSSLPKLEG